MLIRREADPTDRRTSRVALTPAGSRAVATASKTYEAEMATVLDVVFSSEEQGYLHNLVTRLLAAMTDREPADRESAG